MENPEDLDERAVPEDDEPRDSLEQAVSALARAILEIILKRGPTTIRQFKRLGYNPPTLVPVLQELVEIGFLWRDEKRGSGISLPYHLTNDGASIVVPNWQRMNVLEKLKAANPLNYKDLGIFSDLEEYVSTQQVIQAGLNRGNSTLTAAPKEDTKLSPAVNIDPKLLESLLTLARSNNPALKAWASTGFYWAHRPREFLQMIERVDQDLLRRESQRR